MVICAWGVYIIGRLMWKYSAANCKMCQHVLRIYTQDSSSIPTAYVCEHRPGWQYLILGNTVSNPCINYRVGDSSGSSSEVYSMRRPDSDQDHAHV